MNSGPGLRGQSKRSSALGGIILIAMGAVILAAQLEAFANLRLFFLPALGLLFLAWGIPNRSFGLVIPGGILCGIGVGIAIIAGPAANAAEPVKGAIFFLAFAAGWLLIALLSTFTDATFQWWPLVPALILGSIGGLLLAGDAGQQVLRGLSYLAPLALMGVGAWILFRRRP